MYFVFFTLTASLFALNQHCRFCSSQFAFSKSVSTLLSEIKQAVSSAKKTGHRRQAGH